MKAAPRWWSLWNRDEPYDHKGLSSSKNVNDLGSGCFLRATRWELSLKDTFISVCYIFRVPSHSVTPDSGSGQNLKELLPGSAGLRLISTWEGEWRLRGDIIKRQRTGVDLKRGLVLLPRVYLTLPIYTSAQRGKLSPKGAAPRTLP